MSLVLETIWDQIFRQINTVVPMSLDDQAVYTLEFQSVKFGNNEGTGRGTGYKINDIVTLSDTDSQVSLKLTAVDATGGALQGVWISNILVDTSSSVKHFIENYYNAPEEERGCECETVTSGEGTGLVVNIEMKRASGSGTQPGEGATIKVTSEANIEVNTAFVGNRIDTTKSKTG